MRHANSVTLTLARPKMKLDLDAVPVPVPVRGTAGCVYASGYGGRYISHLPCQSAPAALRFAFFGFCSGARSSPAVLLLRKVYGFLLAALHIFDAMEDLALPNARHGYDACAAKVLDGRRQARGCGAAPRQHKGKKDGSPVAKWR